MAAGDLRSLRDLSRSPCSTRTQGTLLEGRSHVRHLLDPGNLVPQPQQILKSRLVSVNNTANCPLLVRILWEYDGISISGLVKATG